MIETLTFVHGGVTLVADLYLPDAAAGPVPGVVTAPGFGAVKEMILPAFASALADAGIACLAFDYAGFGASGGEPRQHVDPTAQVGELRAALDVVAGDHRVDPSRLGVWGPSLTGGHTLNLAAADERVRGAVALIPFLGVDPAAVDPSVVGVLMADVDGRPAGRAPRVIRAVGRPGELAVMTGDGALERCEQLAADAPRFRNEVTLASLVALAGYHPAGHASGISVPLRVIVAAEDSFTPPERVRTALAAVADLDVVELPVTPFDLFDQHLDTVIGSTVDWFVTHLDASLIA